MKKLFAFAFLAFYAGMASAAVVNIISPAKFMWTHDRVSTSGYELRVDCTDPATPSTCAHLVDFALPATNENPVDTVVPAPIALGMHSFALTAYHLDMTVTPAVKVHSVPSNSITATFIALVAPSGFMIQ